MSNKWTIFHHISKRTYSIFELIQSLAMNSDKNRTKNASSKQVIHNTGKRWVIYVHFDRQTVSFDVNFASHANERMHDVRLDDSIESITLLSRVHCIRVLVTIQFSIESMHTVSVWYFVLVVCVRWLNEFEAILKWRQSNDCSLAYNNNKLIFIWISWQIKTPPNNFIHFVLFGCCWFQSFWLLFFHHWFSQMW